MDYIAFIAGLPEMARGEWKPPLSVFDFREQLKDYVREKDRQLLDLFFLPRDHVQVLRLLRKEKPDALQTVFPLQVLEEEVMAPDDRIPAYLRHFITDFKEGHLEEGLLPENVLSWRYYDYLQQSGNRLVREYAAYSLNLKNLEVALNARKHGREIVREIVGTNAFADALRASGSRDFGLSADYPYVEQVIAIMELEDLVERERRLDLMLWDFLEEAVKFEYFSFERVLSYMLRLMLLERWERMSPETGRRVFMELLERFRQGFQFKDV